MRVGVLSDTHVPSRARTLSVQAFRALADADLILHAGDVCDPGLLDELADLAPTRAVLGNGDPPEVARWGAEETLVVEIGQAKVAMIHDAGRREGRPQRMKRRFPDADVVVYGHSHLPVIERHGDLLLLNPGSPTDRRRAPHHTLALLDVSEDGAVEARLLQLD